MVKLQMVVKPMKQKLLPKKHIWQRLTALPVLVLAVLLTVTLSIAPRVRADQFDDQIAALQQVNAQNKGSLNDLLAQASSFQDAIYKLQLQINALQQLIDQNIAEQTRLQGQITANEQELARQRRFLGEGIKSMYVDGQPTTIEMLATSKNLSDFVDKEEYRTNVQKKIQDTLKKINELQKQLSVQKTAIDQLLNDQRAQQAQLDSGRYKQSQMLAYNQSQQAQYNQQIATNQTKIGDLRKQQAILNAKYNIGNMRGDPNNGGYPSVWASAGQDSMVDSWGMFNRECVSYTAFMVHQDYLAGKNDRDMPYWGGIGNANQWDDNAHAAGIPTDSNPTAGSIAISNAGFYGHAMYVAAVSTMNGQEAIYVQQYNANLNGQYSEGWRYSTGLVFLHF
jgi:peptidoglycan hydrolase CwlO-like protein